MRTEVLREKMKKREREWGSTLESFGGNTIAMKRQKYGRKITYLYWNTEVYYIW